MSRCLLALVLSLYPVFAQNTFEVASVKQAQPPFRRVAMTGGPGTADPTRVRFENFSLRALVEKAYQVDYYQIEGPEWTQEVCFNVDATLPRDTSKEQFAAMLRNLLIERFHLSAHREKKELPVWSLEVAKNGPKLADAKPADPSAEPHQPAGELKKDKDGYPQLTPGMQMAMMSDHGHPRARLQGSGETMAWLGKLLTGQLNAPVVDATGLTGRYDFTLSWAPQQAGPRASDTDDSAPSLFAALQEQLGLKLVSKKGPVEIVVIDHAEKTPTEN